MSKVTSAIAEADHTISFTFEKKPKKKNIFSEATERFGEERCKEALAIIDSFIDEIYLKALGREHPAMNKAQRMAFAIKILDCENETDIDNCNFLTSSKYMLKNINKKECDPTILYATTPQVLGYWLERTFQMWIFIV